MTGRISGYILIQRFLNGIDDIAKITRTILILCNYERTRNKGFKHDKARYKKAYEKTLVLK